MARDLARDMARDSGDESDASHASMPDLVAVTPPRSPQAAPASPTLPPCKGKLGGEGAVSALRRLGIIPTANPLDRGLARLTGRNRGAEAESRSGESAEENCKPLKRPRLSAQNFQSSLGHDAELPVNPRENASADKSTPVDDAAASVFRLSADVTFAPSVNFAPKADLLAQALDRLGAHGSAPAAAEVAGGVFSAKVDLLAPKADPFARKVIGATASSSTAAAAPQKDSRSTADDPGVELSAASDRLLGMQRDELDDSLGGADDDSSVEDPEESGPSTKRRRLSENDRPLAIVPPGAPAAAPASLAVASAASAAPLESCGRPNFVPPARKKQGVCSEPEEGGWQLGVASGKGKGKSKDGKGKSKESYGPRFRGMAPSDMEKAKSKWSLHSLADVSTTSSEGNRRAASALFEDLRKRRAAADGTEAAAADDGAAPCKPTFRRPVAAQSNDSTGTGESARDLACGTRVMPECLPGARPQRSNGCAAVAAAPAPRRAAVNLRPAVACAASAVEELQEAATAQRSTAAASQKAARAARRKNVSFDEDDMI